MPAKSSVGTSAVQLVATATPVTYHVVVRADPANSSTVYVGTSSGVTAGTADATDGTPLRPGEFCRLVGASVKDASSVWLVSPVTGQRVFYAVDSVDLGSAAAGSNAETTLLASAARTTTQVGANQTCLGGKGVRLVLNVTSASGSGGLVVRVNGVDPTSGVTYQLNASPTAVTAIGTTVYDLYPGIGAAAGGITQTTSQVLPRTFRVDVTVGDATSYTYSLSQVILL